MMTDTHAHLFWDSFKKDFDEVIKRALENKVTTIINVGTNLETSKKALEQAEDLTEKYSSSEVEKLQLYSSIGIHPHDAIKHAGKQAIGSEAQVIDSEVAQTRGARRGTVDRVQLEKDIETLEEIYLKSKDPSTHSARSGPRVVAVGECGLDFNFRSRDFIPSDLSIDEIKNLQKLLLKAQVNLAKKLNLPLLIHTRDAWDEIFDFISDHFGILHCFSGDLEILKKALKTNFLLSFPATITYPKNNTLREVVKQTPTDRIVFETDCPFLPPQQMRGARNEPSNIVETVRLAAEIKNLSFEKLSIISTDNAKKVLKI